jgi:hypothetical protein
LVIFEVDDKRLSGIRKRDKACITHGDGSLAAAEAGDNVAEDRRYLLEYIAWLEENSTV